MGFLKGLLGLGVTAGAAFAALKVAQKYEENKAADAAAAAAGAEPQDVPAGSVLEDIARAAGGVLSDAGAKVKEVVTGTAEKAGVDTVELKGALHDAGDALYEAGDAVADAGSAFASRPKPPHRRRRSRRREPRQRLRRNSRNDFAACTNKMNKPPAFTVLKTGGFWRGKWLFYIFQTCYAEWG